jgi:hypothetical protein
MRGEIFFIGLQVFRNAVDPLSQQGNLALDGPSVGSLATKISEETRSFFFCQIRHLNFYLMCTGDSLSQINPSPVHG